MEKDIFNKLLLMAYNSKIDELYNKKEIKFDYPIEINELSFNVLLDFNYQYYKKYKNLIVKNALVYIIDNNLSNYLDIFNGDKKTIESLLDNEKVFQAKITSFAFYNLRNKYEFNINYEYKIINENKELFDKVCNMYEINSITNIYRNVIINYINKYNTTELEELIDEILVTNKYDYDLISDNSDKLSISNINIFKKILFKLILSDNYILLKNIEKDDNEDNYIEYDEEYKEEAEVLTFMESKLLDYIEDLIDDNKFSLPKEREIRLNLYSNFITYNLYNKDFNIDYFKEDNELVKKLKKINPLYPLDSLNDDNV